MRTHAASPEFFRLVVTNTHANGETHTSYLGPWSTHGMAKAQRKRLSRWYPGIADADIERCSPEWEVVE